MDDPTSDDMTADVDAPDLGAPATVAALEAERDALRAELEAVARKRTLGERVRRVAAPLLVLVFAASLLGSGVGVWLHRNTLNDDVWAERVVPLGEDPAVQTALSIWTTDQLMALVDPKAFFEEALPDRAAILAVPLTAAVRDYVAGRVDEFFASERFEELWARAAIAAHSAAVSTLRGERPALVADDEKVTINLIPLIDAVLARVLDAAPGLVGSDVTLPEVSVTDVPEVARERIASALGVELDDDFGTLTVYDGGTLSSAQTVVRWFDDLVVVFALLTVVSAAAALWLSPRRRRTTFQLLGATALVAISLRRIVFVLQEQVADVVEEANRAATAVVVATFVDPLTAAAATVLWVVAVAAVVLALTGPYGWAVSLRRTLSGGATSVSDAAGTLATNLGERAADPGTSLWIS